MIFNFIKDLYYKIKVWIWNKTHPNSLYGMWYGKVKPTKSFKAKRGKEI